MNFVCMTGELTLNLTFTPQFISVSDIEGPRRHDHNLRTLDVIRVKPYGFLVYIVLNLMVFWFISHLNLLQCLFSCKSKMYPSHSHTFH